MQVLPFIWRTDGRLIPISCLSIPSSQCSLAVEILIVRVGRPFTTVIEARESRSSVRWTTIWRWERPGIKELSSCSCYQSVLSCRPFRYFFWSGPCPSQLFLATSERQFWQLRYPSPTLLIKPPIWVGLCMRINTGRYKTAKLNVVTLTSLEGE